MRSASAPGRRSASASPSRPTTGPTASSPLRRREPEQQRGYPGAAEAPRCRGARRRCVAAAHDATGERGRRSAGPRARAPRARAAPITHRRRPGAPSEAAGYRPGCSWPPRRSPRPAGNMRPLSCRAGRDRLPAGHPRVAGERETAVQGDREIDLSTGPEPSRPGAVKRAGRTRRWRCSGRARPRACAVASRLGQPRDDMYSSPSLPLSPPFDRYRRVAHRSVAFPAIRKSRLAKGLSCSGGA
jgi:hypothetical protein